MTLQKSRIHDCGHSGLLSVQDSPKNDFPLHAPACSILDFGSSVMSPGHSTAWHDFLRALPSLTHALPWGSMLSPFKKGFPSLLIQDSIAGLARWLKVLALRKSKDSKFDP